jgi:hypothetical protein
MCYALCLIITENKYINNFAYLLLHSLIYLRTAWELLAQNRARHDPNHAQFGRCLHSCPILLYACASKLLSLAGQAVGKKTKVTFVFILYATNCVRYLVKQNKLQNFFWFFANESIYLSYVYKKP